MNTKKETTELLTNTPDTHAGKDGATVSLQVSNLGLDLSMNPILRDITFTLSAHGMNTLNGPSGAGKSTLLRCLNQLHEVGYPSIYGKVTITQWNQRMLPLVSLPKRGLITRVTTPIFWRGFRMTLPALTTLTGFDGKVGLSARRVMELRAGA